MTCHNNSCIPWKTLVECDHLKSVVMAEKREVAQSKAYQEFLDTYRAKITTFIKSLMETIELVEMSERKKYTKKELYMVTMVYDDKDCHNEDQLNKWDRSYVRSRNSAPSPLHPGNATQYMSYWEGDEWKQQNYTQFAVESSIIKLLWYRNKMTNILAMIGRGVRLQILDSLVDFKGSFGLRDIMRDALRMYIYVNFHIAAGTVNKKVIDPKTGELVLPIFKNTLLDKGIRFRIFDSFLVKRDDVSVKLSEDYKTDNNISKLAFRILYQYSMMSREWGRHINWFDEIQTALLYDYSFLLNQWYWIDEEEDEDNKYY
ncbi:hypothetical protein DFA_09273 [Cavenderia fasciculata]|uniref:Uncharacterized protein n=1 Tax=Cavenderia fasciculata TaxID=261658 RepID=F4Q761_CACFS|nr:uncharacterized protein DFA_09273 [Cavenderia fasciculata]EGG16243.1 hypothetical protein DFA_09273 [Cavenderia fasciculata]|eukprot:XP_004354627.1 hypothetical protein DFA_09273 [Cavenderia fasciculata]